MHDSEPDPDQALLNELLVGEYEDYMAAEGMDMDMEDDEGEEGDGEGGEDQAEENPGGDTAVGGGDNQDASVVSGESKASRAAAAALKARRPVRVDYTALAAYLMSGSSIASVLKACLHLEDETTFYQAERHIALFTPLQAEMDQSPPEEGVAGEEEDVAEQRRVLLHPDLDLDYMVRRPPSAADGERDSDHEGTPRDSAPAPASAPVLHIPLESVSRTMNELKAQGVTAFLTDMMLAPKKAARVHALSWGTWRALLEVMRTGLKTDFDALQKWRYPFFLTLQGFASLLKFGIVTGWTPDC